tara:strand:+ start:1367 stop:1579 length:213 start_codon:yes stop_codon:yes gene_type:complete
MESVNSRKLKKGLVKIKRTLDEKVGAVWKLKKAQVIDKIKDLKYDYDEKSNSLRASKKSAMIRKPTNVKL